MTTLLIIVAIAVVLGGAWYLKGKKGPQKPAQTPPQQPQSPAGM